MCAAHLPKAESELQKDHNKHTEPNPTTTRANHGKLGRQLGSKWNAETEYLLGELRYWLHLKLFPKRIA